MTYDLIVIGSGPGGYSAAIRAGQYGLKTAIVEKDPKLGGTCLHVGCIPTKALLHTADLWEHFVNPGDEGIQCENPRLDYAKVLDRKNKIVSKHAKGVEFLMKKNKVDWVKGYGTILPRSGNGPIQVEVKSETGTQTLQTKNVIIATGSEARMLPGLEPDEKAILTNIEILDLPVIPKTMLIIGAGAVGVEFGSIFKSFGSDISIVEYLPRLVPAEDEEVSKELARSFKKRGIDTNVGAKVEKVETTKSGVKVTFTASDGKTVVKEAEKVLVAVGRAPRTEGIGLEKTKIAPDRGFIKVNEYMQTDEPGVYAIGDIVAGMPQLAHSGAMAGIVAVTKIAGKYARPVKRERIPGCTYTEPQIGSVGLTEAKAREKGLNIKVGKFPFVGNSKATILDAHDGFVKVIADAKYGEILGVHIIGPQATELIAEAVTAMELEATVEDMMWIIHAHPTLAESMLDGFSSVEGMAINV